MKPVELLSQAKEQLESAKEFEFWKLIESLEETEFETGGTGSIEENVVIKGILFIEPGAVIKSGSRIEGNVFIGKNSVIGPNAYLRKNVVIGENCHVSNSEIKNSIILNNSNVSHYSYIGDSVIGEQVNFGAGAKIANLRFDNKNVLVEVNCKKIDSGKRKLGVCIGSKTKIGINASINCGVLVGKNCFVYPGTVVSKNLASGNSAKL